MRKAAGGFVAWLALAVGMSVVAWQAVSYAGAQVNDAADRPVAAAPVVPSSNAAVSSSSSSLTLDDVPPDTTLGASSTLTSPPSTLATPATGTAPTTTTSTTPSTSITAAPGTSASPTTTTTTATSTTTVTSTTGGQWEATTWTLVGGTVTIRSRPGEVELVSAVPNAGFSSQVDASGPTRVRVDFESTDHESKFEAKWESGELDVKLDES